MIEIINLILQHIIVDFFEAFALTSLVILILSLYVKSPILQLIEEETKKTISLFGLIYLFVWILGVLIFYNRSNQEDKNMLLLRMFGPYWIYFWLQPIIWISISQLIRVKRLWKNILMRLLFCFLFLFSIEKVIMATITFHRDYLPSTWTIKQGLGIYPDNFFLEFIFKIFYFLFLVGFFYSLKQKNRNVNSK